jgi:protein-S-isoprenylcysteine O-methyltransferase Ste14
MNNEVAARPGRHPVVRKAVAGFVLIVAAVLVLQLVIHFAIAIFGTVVAVAAVIAIIWALKTIFW